MDQKMILLNKDHPVLRLLYDDEIHAITKILEPLELQYAPPAILNYKGVPDKRTLNDWWRNRAIPASRNHLHNDFPYLNDTRILAEESMGLSLSDRYWMRPDDLDLKWKDVNFFENPFTDDLGLITLGEKQQSYDSSEDMYSPNSTLGGDLRKKWTIQDEKRILLKSGSGPFLQEPYNEVIATALHKRLLGREDFVPYALDNHHCSCPNMLEDNEELIPVWDVIASRRKPNDKNDFEFCLDTYEDLGIPRQDAYRAFKKMFTCDTILVNRDRHYRNFGLIRNVETLDYVRTAPIYDTGACLWHDKIILSELSDYKYRAKPFNPNGMEPKKQLGLFHKFDWFDEKALKDFPEEASEILKKNPLMNDKRRDAVLYGLNRNIMLVADYVRGEGLAYGIGIHGESDDIIL